MLVLIAAWLGGCDRAPLLVQTGAQAPAFSLPRLEGGTAAFPGDYPGRVVAIRFWADWCPYCRSEMQAPEPLYRDLRERGYAVQRGPHDFRISGVANGQDQVSPSTWCEFSLSGT